MDTEAVSLCQNTNARVAKTLSNCDKRNQLTDTYCVDHLLSKVSSEHVTVRSCLSPAERVGLPYFKNYLNPSLLKNNDFLCIPLCDSKLFGKVDVLYESYFTERQQFNANSCGVWLTAAITSFILQLPVVTDRNHAFNMCYSLSERERPLNYVKDEIPAPPSVNVSSDKQIKHLHQQSF